MVGLGYKNTGHTFGDYQIWKRDNSRILFNQYNNNVIAEYNINSREGKEFHEQYVNESE